MRVQTLPLVNEGHFAVSDLKLDPEAQSQGLRVPRTVNAQARRFSGSPGALQVGMLLALRRELVST
jgi:hypothetical protein